MPPIAGGKPLMWFAWTSGRALRAGEDLRYRRPAGSDRRGPFATLGCSTRPGCWRTARSRGSPPPVKGVAVDRLLLAARLAAAGVDLSGRLSEFFLVDFVPLLSRADDVVLMAMNMCPFLPNCVDVTRWRRHRFSPGDTGCGSGRARCAGTALWAGAMPPASRRSKQDHCAEDGVNSVNPHPMLAPTTR